MWDEIVKNLADYSSAVLSAVDENGYPLSVRCQPVPDDARQVLRIEDPAGHSLQPGPASLLCHWHNEKLWDLRSFNLRGRLELNGDAWLFRPERIMSGAASSLSSIWKARKRAGSYLEKRGLDRPSIPWKDYKAIWTELEKSR